MFSMKKLFTIPTAVVPPVNVPSIFRGQMGPTQSNDPGPRGPQRPMPQQQNPQVDLSGLSDEERRQIEAVMFAALQSEQLPVSSTRTTGNAGKPQENLSADEGGRHGKQLQETVPQFPGAGTTSSFPCPPTESVQPIPAAPVPRLPEPVPITGSCFQEPVSEPVSDLSGLTTEERAAIERVLRAAEAEGAITEPPPSRTVSRDFSPAQNLIISLSSNQWQTPLDEPDWRSQKKLQSDWPAKKREDSEETAGADSNNEEEEDKDDSGLTESGDSGPEAESDADAEAELDEREPAVAIGGQRYYQDMSATAPEPVSKRDSEPVPEPVGLDGLTAAERAHIEEVMRKAQQMLEGDQPAEPAAAAVGRTSRKSSTDSFGVPAKMAKVQALLGQKAADLVSSDWTSPRKGSLSKENSSALIGRLDHVTRLTSQSVKSAKQTLMSMSDQALHSLLDTGDNEAVTNEPTNAAVTGATETVVQPTLQATTEYVVDEDYYYDQKQEDTIAKERKQQQQEYNRRYSASPSLADETGEQPNVAQYAADEYPSAGGYRFSEADDQYQLPPTAEYSYGEREYVEEYDISSGRITVDNRQLSTDRIDEHETDNRFLDDSSYGASRTAEVEVDYQGKQESYYTEYEGDVTVEQQERYNDERWIEEEERRNESGAEGRWAEEGQKYDEGNEEEKESEEKGGEENEVPEWDSQYLDVEVPEIQRSTPSPRRENPFLRSEIDEVEYRNDADKATFDDGYQYSTTEAVPAEFEEGEYIPEPQGYIEHSSVGLDDQDFESSRRRPESADYYGAEDQGSMVDERYGTRTTREPPYIDEAGYVVQQQRNAMETYDDGVLVADAAGVDAGDDETTRRPSNDDWRQLDTVAGTANDDLNSWPPAQKDDDMFVYEAKPITPYEDEPEWNPAKTDPSSRPAATAQPTEDYHAPASYDQFAGYTVATSETQFPPAKQQTEPILEPRTCNLVEEPQPTVSSRPFSTSQSYVGSPAAAAAAVKSSASTSSLGHQRSSSADVANLLPETSFPAAAPLAKESKSGGGGFSFGGFPKSLTSFTGSLKNQAMTMAKKASTSATNLAMAPPAPRQQQQHQPAPSVAPTPTVPPLQPPGAPSPWQQNYADGGENVDGYRAVETGPTLMDHQNSTSAAATVVDSSTNGRSGRGMSSSTASFGSDLSRSATTDDAGYYSQLENGSPEEKIAGYHHEQQQQQQPERQIHGNNTSGMEDSGLPDLSQFNEEERAHILAMFYKAQELESEVVNTAQTPTVVTSDFRHNEPPTSQEQNWFEPVTTGTMPTTTTLEQHPPIFYDSSEVSSEYLDDEDDEQRRIKDIEEEFAIFAENVVRGSMASNQNICPLCCQPNLEIYAGKTVTGQTCSECGLVTCSKCGRCSFNVHPQKRFWICSMCNSRRELAELTEHYQRKKEQKQKKQQLEQQQRQLYETVVTTKSSTVSSTSSSWDDIRDDTNHKQTTTAVPVVTAMTTKLYQEYGGSEVSLSSSLYSEDNNVPEQPWLETAVTGTRLGEPWPESAGPIPQLNIECPTPTSSCSQEEDSPAKAKTAKPQSDESDEEEQEVDSDEDYPDEVIEVPAAPMEYKEDQDQEPAFSALGDEVIKQITAAFSGDLPDALDQGNIQTNQAGYQTGYKTSKTGPETVSEQFKTAAPPLPAASSTSEVLPPYYGTIQENEPQWTRELEPVSEPVTFLQSNPFTLTSQEPSPPVPLTLSATNPFLDFTYWSADDINKSSSIQSVAGSIQPITDSIQFGQFQQLDSLEPATDGAVNIFQDTGPFLDGQYDPSQYEETAREDDRLDRQEEEIDMQQAARYYHNAQFIIHAPGPVYTIPEDEDEETEAQYYSGSSMAGSTGRLYHTDIETPSEDGSDAGDFVSRICVSTQEQFALQDTEIADEFVLAGGYSLTGLTSRAMTSIGGGAGGVGGTLPTTVVAGVAAIPLTLAGTQHQHYQQPTLTNVTQMYQQLPSNVLPSAGNGSTAVEHGFNSAQPTAAAAQRTATGNEMTRVVSSEQYLKERALAIQSSQQQSSVESKSVAPLAPISIGASAYGPAPLAPSICSSLSRDPMFTNFDEDTIYIEHQKHEGPSPTKKKQFYYNTTAISTIQQQTESDAKRLATERQATATISESAAMKSVAELQRIDVLDSAAALQPLLQMQSSGVFTAGKAPSSTDILLDHDVSRSLLERQLYTAVDPFYASCLSSSAALPATSAIHDFQAMISAATKPAALPGFTNAGSGFPPAAYQHVMSTFSGDAATSLVADASSQSFVSKLKRSPAMILHGSAAPPPTPQQSGGEQMRWSEEDLATMGRRRLPVVPGQPVPQQLETLVSSDKRYFPEPVPMLPQRYQSCFGAKDDEERDAAAEEVSFMQLLRRHQQLLGSGPSPTDSGITKVPAAGTGPRSSTAEPTVYRPPAAASLASGSRRTVSATLARVLVKQELKRALSARRTTLEAVEIEANQREYNIRQMLLGRRYVRHQYGELAPAVVRCELSPTLIAGARVTPPFHQPSAFAAAAVEDNTSPERLNAAQKRRKLPAVDSSLTNQQRSPPMRQPMRNAETQTLSKSALAQEQQALAELRLLRQRSSGTRDRFYGSGSSPGLREAEYQHLLQLQQQRRTQLTRPVSPVRFRSIGTSTAEPGAAANHEYRRSHRRKKKYLDYFSDDTEDDAQSRELRKLKLQDEIARRRQKMASLSDLSTARDPAPETFHTQALSLGGAPLGHGSLPQYGSLPRDLESSILCRYSSKYGAPLKSPHQQQHQHQFSSTTDGGNMVTELAAPFKQHFYTPTANYNNCSTDAPPLSYNNCYNNGSRSGSLPKRAATAPYCDDEYDFGLTQFRDFRDPISVATAGQRPASTAVRNCLSETQLETVAGPMMRGDYRNAGDNISSSSLQYFQDYNRSQVPPPRNQLLSSFATPAPQAAVAPFAPSVKPVLSGSGFGSGPGSCSAIHPEFVSRYANYLSNQYLDFCSPAVGSTRVYGEDYGAVGVHHPREFLGPDPELRFFGGLDVTCRSPITARHFASRPITEQQRSHNSSYPAMIGYNAAAPNQIAPKYNTYQPQQPMASSFQYSSLNDYFNLPNRFSEKLRPFSQQLYNSLSSNNTTQNRVSRTLSSLTGSTTIPASYGPIGVAEEGGFPVTGGNNTRSSSTTTLQQQYRSSPQLASEYWQRQNNNNANSQQHGSGCSIFCKTCNFPGSQRSFNHRQQEQQQYNNQSSQNLYSQQLLQTQPPVQHQQQQLIQQKQHQQQRYGATNPQQPQYMKTGTRAACT